MGVRYCSLKNIEVFSYYLYTGQNCKAKYNHGTGLPWNQPSQSNFFGDHGRQRVITWYSQFSCLQYCLSWWDFVHVRCCELGPVLGRALVVSRTWAASQMAGVGVQQSSV